MINEKELGSNIADNFEKILIDKKKTIPEVAQEMGNTRWAVNLFLSNLRKGKGGNISTICKYSEALKVSPYDLYGEYKLTPLKSKKRESKPWII